MPPTRKQTDITTVTTWQELDVALGILRVTNATIAGDNAHHDTRIQALQAAKQEALQPHLDKRARLEKLVETFVRGNRATLGPRAGAKSRKLVHGVVGFKAGRKRVVFVQGAVAAMKALRARDHLDCIRVKESLDKKKLADLPEAERRLCGITVAPGAEVFFYTLNETDPVEYPDVVGGEAS